MNNEDMVVLQSIGVKLKIITGLLGNYVVFKNVRLGR